MALERDGIQLVAEGAAQFISQLQSADASLSGFIAKLTASSRIRTPQLAPDIKATTDAFNAAVTAGGEFVGTLLNVGNAAAKAKSEVDQVARAAESLKAAPPNFDFGFKARADLEAGIRGNVSSGRDFATTNLNSQRAQALTAAVPFDPSNASRFAATLGLVQSATKGVSDASNTKNRALHEQSDEEGKAHSTGITYLSTLSAIHAASFLVGGQTFTTAGSLVTMSLAFSKLGPAGLIGGAALGTVFVATKSLTDAFQTLVDVAGNALQVIATGAVAAGAAVAAGIGVAITQAGGLETQFALVRGVTGATNDKLAQLQTVVVGLSREFGVSSSDVANAASLYSRAGGTIEDAINGATRAVVALTVASAGELGAPQAARAVAQLQNAFKVGAGEAADFITGVAQTTTLSFSEVTQALQQVGPVAANLKIPLLDVGAAIGVAADAGLRGTVAGSSLKQMFSDLANPSKQAAVLLKQYDISLFDSAGHVRPLIDVFRDMNAAFGENAVASGRVNDAQRAQALSVIFGARAGQAAAVIAASGAAAFDDLRQKIEGVTATDLANQLLLPLNKQLDISKQNALALAGAFGGPLVTALGAGAAHLNGLLKSIDTKPFEVAGQAVVALATGQGFGQLGEALDSLVSDSNARKFIDDLLNALLNVRAAIVNDIIPAVQSAAAQIGTALQGIDITSVLAGISREARVVGAVVGVLVGQFGGLVASIIENRDRGAELRTQVVGLAAAFGTSLVAGIALAAVPILVTIELLKNLGKNILDILDRVDEFDTLWSAAWELAKNIVRDAVRNIISTLITIGPALAALATGNVVLLAQHIEALVAKADGLDVLGQRFSTGAEAIQALDSEIAKTSIDLIKLQATSRVLSPEEKIRVGIEFPPDEAQKMIAASTEIQSFQLRIKSLQDQRQTIANNPVQEFKGLVAGVRSAADAASKFDLSSVTDKAQGDVTDLLTRITSIPTTISDAARAGANGADTTDSGFLPNANEAEKITAKIVEFIADMNTKINNLEEDGVNNQNKVFQNATEKLLDGFTKFKQQIQQIDKQTNQHIAEIDTDTAISRAERTSTEEFRHNQEDQATSRSENLEIQERGHQNFIESIRLGRQRDTEDLTRNLNTADQITERSYNTRVEIANQAFQRTQRAQSDSFQDQQSDRERKFREGQKREADARQLGIQLANAKTPEEKANVSKQASQAKLDAEFSKKQETELIQFQKQQRTQQENFSDNLQDQAFARRIAQQIDEFNFRLKIEAGVMAYRRALEDEERGIRTGEDFQELFRRQGLSRTNTTFQRGQALELQALQDAIQDFQNNRQKAKIRETAEEQKRTLTTNFAEIQQKNIREILETIDNLGTSQAKSTRATLDTIADKRDDFIKQAQRAGVPLPPEFFQLDILENKVLELGAAFEAANNSKKQLLGEQFGQSVLDAKSLVPSLNTPAQVQSVAVPATTLALNATLGLPADFSTQMSQAVFDAMQKADRAGLLQRPLPTVQPTGQPNIDTAIQKLNTMLQGIR